MPSFSIDSAIHKAECAALGNTLPHPLIAVTGNWDENQLKLAPGYIRSLEAAGAHVVVLPPRRTIDASLIDELGRLDGILLSGGADLNPLYVGEDPCPALHGINHERDAFELSLIRLAYNRQIPMFGICRGIQMLAAALGGTILQDLKTAMPEAQLIKHSQDAARSVATHWVKATEGSLMERLLGERFAVNSFHHQAVGNPGPLFRVTARSADGVVEAIESTEKKSIFGVQWHPECFNEAADESMMPLFSHFVDEARSFMQVRDLHRHTLTLDSHCDTPMFFDKGVKLDHRDPQLCVDWCKMREGLLDASIMVAYLPQGARDEATLKAVTAETHRILDEIETRVAASPNVALAANPADLYHNKAQGKLSVMRGIENGYALGRDLSNVEAFRRKGVVYITLCHNGNNDICDSARNQGAEHNGLSDYGREVVREMNRCGLMVDLSHAAEKSFYDALAWSQTPIVCSHSSSRALCNHPRNLTDDQLRALAAHGGVAQVTLYHGFLSDNEDKTPADIDLAVRHIMHMIDVAGIDHVGIGTDFDGDGGILGCSCASELPNFTRRLLAEGLTHSDLEKIWGGNFLRVMKICQNF